MTTPEDLVRGSGSEPQFPTIELVGRETMVEEITRHLMQFVLSGELAPGSKLPSERKLAEAFGIGRSAVREAIKSLDLLGIVEVRQGDGTYLKRTESELLPKAIEWGLLLGQRRTHDLVEARRHIEIAVAGLAAARASSSDVTALRKILDRLRDASSTEEFVQHDIAFHMKVAEIAQNTVLADMLSSIRTLLQVWITRVVDVSGERKSSYAEHVKVFRAIQKGDSEAATGAMTAHMESAGGKLVASLRERDPGLTTERADAREARAKATPASL